MLARRPTRSRRWLWCAPEPLTAGIAYTRCGSSLRPFGSRPWPCSLWTGAVCLVEGHQRWCPSASAQGLQQAGKRWVL